MSKILSMEEIRKISKQSHRILYGEDAIICPDVMTDPSPDIFSSNIPSPDKVNPIHVNKRLENALKIMKAQADYRHVFLFRQEASMIAGIKGGATLANAENEALRVGVIKKHSIAKAKTEICFWEIMASGYKYLNCSPKQWQSKGGYVHKFCTYRLAETYAKAGYKPTIEHQHVNGKLVDLCLIKDSEIIYIEICASPPLEKELSNLEQDLSGDFLPSKLIFAVTKRSMKKELEAMLPSENKLPCPVEIVLAGNLIDFLGVK